MILLKLKVIASILSVLFLVVMIGGCAGKSLSTSDRQLLNSISIDPESVSLSGESGVIWFNTSSSALATVLGGIVGGVLYEGLHDKSPEEAVLFLFNKNQMLKNTVSESFKYQFEKSNTFNVTNRDNADAYLNIEITSIQFHQLSGNKLTMSGQCRARLISTSDGRVFWENLDQFSPFNSQLVEYSFEEYISNSTKLRYALSVLSQMLAGEFVENLGGTKVLVNNELHKVENM